MWRRKADWCTRRVSGRSILLAVNCGPVELPSPRSAVARSTSSKFWFALGGELVTKHDLASRVWPGAIVEDNALQFHISAIRKALGPDRELLRRRPGVAIACSVIGHSSRRARQPAGSINLEPVQIAAERFRTNLARGSIRPGRPNHGGAASARSSVRLPASHADRTRGHRKDQACIGGGPRLVSELPG